MNRAAFKEAWYAEMIERFDSSNGNVTSRAILAGFCILAQAIDELTTELTHHRPE